MSSCRVGQTTTTHQKRTNFEYQGVTFALKWTPDWLYHFEAEIVVSNKEQQTAARQKIINTCTELSLTPLSDWKLREFPNTLGK